MKIYGIKNCDTVKKALAYFKSNTLEFEFIDLKTTQLDHDKLASWLANYQDELINKRSTTYRQIKSQVEATSGNQEALITLIQSNQTLLKRPIIEHKKQLVIGYQANIYDEKFL